MNKSNYPYNWKEISLQVKLDADWCCVRCGHEHDPAGGYCLTVHHLDGDPTNNAWWNLAALCQRCHLHIQGKVRMPQYWMFEHADWFKPYVAGYYAHIHNHLEDRDWVGEHIELLLSYGKSI
jgi:5-methylcytosine-specific restriction endonuclease McrA